MQKPKSPSPDMARWAPITQFLGEDVFIVGFPKSRNTWFQYLTAGVVFGLDPELGPDTLVQELVPDVHYKQQYKRFRTPTFFKSHELPKPEYRRVVYLLRDGRDVMVSYFHYLRALRGAGVELSGLIRGKEDVFPCRWHEHVEAWHANPYRADLLVIKYEEMASNGVRQLRRFCEFLGIKKESRDLECIVRKASFKNMSDKEVREGWDNPDWPREKRFLRRGKVGAYQGEMTADLQQAFLGYAGITLRKYGYLTERCE